MKARVKATGEVVTIKPCEPLEIEGLLWPSYEDEYGRKYPFNALEENTHSQDSPDYWTRLEHQYAGMAMQGLSEKYFKEYRDYCAGFGDMDEDEAKGAMKDFANAMADVCYYFAHALVEKLKKKEERK